MQYVRRAAQPVVYENVKTRVAEPVTYETVQIQSPTAVKTRVAQPVVYETVTPETQYVYTSQIPHSRTEHVTRDAQYVHTKTRTVGQTVKIEVEHEREVVGTTEEEVTYTRPVEIIEKIEEVPEEQVRRIVEEVEVIVEVPRVVRRPRPVQVMKEVIVEIPVKQIKEERKEVWTENIVKNQVDVPVEVPVVPSQTRDVQKPQVHVVKKNIREVESFEPRRVVQPHLVEKHTKVVQPQVVRHEEIVQPHMVEKVIRRVPEVQPHVERRVIERFP